VADTVIQAWRPPTDRPVDSDPAIQLHLNFWRKRKLVQPIVVFLVLAALMFLLHAGFSMLGLLFLAAAAMSVTALLQFRARVGWWLKAAPSLLDGAPAVRVRSEAVGGEGTQTLLSIEGGRLCLHVTNTESAVRQFLARQSEVWLVGPNADGVAAVLVDGVPAPIPARVVPAPTAPHPVPVTDEDLPRWAAARAARVVWASIAFVGRAGASLLFDLLLSIDGWTAATIGFFVVLAAALIASPFRRGDQHRMVKLLGNGPWQAYPVQLLSWGGNPAVIGKLRLALTLPDGSQLPVTVRVGPAWLVANITATGYLWVAGPPRPGEATVVGLPGYPQIAAARYRAL
jgi:hypothetical protein